jgi:hypothetical protein
MHSLEVAADPGEVLEHFRLQRLHGPALLLVAKRGLHRGSPDGRMVRHTPLISRWRGPPPTISSSCPGTAPSCDETTRVSRRAGNGRGMLGSCIHRSDWAKGSVSHLTPPQRARGRRHHQPPPPRPHWSRGEAEGCPPTGSRANQLSVSWRHKASRGKSCTAERKQVTLPCPSEAGERLAPQARALTRHKRADGHESPRSELSRAAAPPSRSARPCPPTFAATAVARLHAEGHAGSSSILLCGAKQDEGRAEWELELSLRPLGRGTTIWAALVPLVPRPSLSPALPLR